MVKICPNTYTKKNEDKYIQYFDKYSFPLSSFQKHAIEAIVEGNHILVTAHTGSGKTLPAEFAIEHFTSLPIKKKVIYTSPIKALSNQKFYDFSKKFPHISFGLLTGDIKCNPEADVLIMTAEILLNKLYQQNNDKIINTSSISFDMDIVNELGCVIMDEVHYINDYSRGKVWEQTIMMLPTQVQMVMLSATLDSPEKFALWCETKGDTNVKPDKIVYLTTTNERVVPLTHYSFLTTNSSIYKLEKDKTIQAEIKNFTNKLNIIQNSKGEFNDATYTQMKKILKILNNKQIYIKRQHVLNQVAKYLCENEMLPALCFVFSRKQLEECANELTTNLLEFDSKVPYIIQKECEQIIRKLPNFEEYLQLPEYIYMVSLLQKGIAIHHAGIMPILREMVELLYAKGYIKLLFATETFAVGINMPTKTVLFTSLEKWDGLNSRMLYAHEYTQMAGRAGRRGIDTVGNVIHLNNLFKNVNNEIVNYKTVLKGQPQKLVSKFKISYNLLLNLIDIGNTSFNYYAKRSMIQNDITNDSQKYFYKMQEILNDVDKNNFAISKLNIPLNKLEKYYNLQKERLVVFNSKRKEVEKEIFKMEENYKNINYEINIYKNYKEKENELTNIKCEIDLVESYIDRNIDSVLRLLIDHDFIIKDIENNSNYKLTVKGNIANQLKEVHCLIFSELINNKYFNKLTSSELVGVFSCFANITVTEDLRSLIPCDYNKNVQNVLIDIQNNYKSLQIKEENNSVDTGMEWNIQFDIIKYVIDWCNAVNQVECKLVLQNMYKEKEIFLGEFIKALLKINNISNELEKVAELIGDIDLLYKLRDIPIKTLKYVATNQSLYI
jgi:superfamily II RNA helicase